MKVFDLFVSKYPPGNDLRKPTAETLEQFQGKVPAELLNFWQEYGFGTGIDRISKGDRRQS